MRRVDARHRRARAHARVEALDVQRRGARRRAASRGGSRCRSRWRCPGAAASTVRMMKSVEPTRSATSTTSWAHSGCDHDQAVGVRGAERRDVLGLEALVHRAVPLPQEERRLLHVHVLEPAELAPRVPDDHRRRRRSPSRARCCGRGAGRGRRAPSRPRGGRAGRRAPTRGPGGRWRRCRPRRRGGRRTP